MRIKPLQKRLVSSLKKRAPEIEDNLHWMKNIDSRATLSTVKHSNTEFAGKRVRAMDVRQEFPSIGSVAIKRSHHITAPNLVKRTREIAREHNKRFRPKNYRLVTIPAHAISKWLIAMPRVEGYSYYEHISAGPNEVLAHQRFIKMMTKGASYPQLQKAFEEFRANIKKIRPRESVRKTKILVLGFENGKFVFTMFVDKF